MESKLAKVPKAVLDDKMANIPNPIWTVSREDVTNRGSVFSKRSPIHVEYSKTDLFVLKLNSVLKPIKCVYNAILKEK